MADFNFAPITVTPQQNSLSDVLNMARGVQAYQQAQQLNPLQIQQAQLANQQAQQAYQQAQQLNPITVKKAQAELATSEIGTKQAQQNLNISGQEYAKQLINALPNIESFKDKDGKINQKALKESLGIVRKASTAAGLQDHPSNLLGQLEDAVSSEDYAL